MKKNYHHLEWDSKTFGFNVAKLTMPEYDEAHLLKTLKRLKENNYRLIYWKIPSAIGVEEEKIKSYGGILADEKMTYLKYLKNTLTINQQSSYSIVSYSLREPECALLELAQESGMYSRFKLDPLFPPDLFEKLYHTWMIRSVRREIAHEVLVAKNMDDSLYGVITLGEMKGKGDVGLLAVSHQARGKGLGKLLMINAEKYFLKHGYSEVQVVTQRKNTKACHLYESCGFMVEKIENVYHFWL